MAPKTPAPQGEPNNVDITVHTQETSVGEHIVKRDATTGHWAPGSSGNANGRPKFNPEVKALLWDGVPKAIKFCIGILENDGAETKDRLIASRMLLEWGLSKPSADLPGEQTSVLAALAGILARAKAPGMPTAELKSIRAPVDVGGRR
jgi:hypothetical protein